MKQKTFYHYANGKRPVTVKIHDDYISFHFKAEGDREFYSIPKSEWISDHTTTRQDRPDNWHFHMMDKTWFNEDMEEFINECTLTKK